MEQVKVLEEFIDIHTGKMHRAGEVFDADENRIAEIMAVSKKLIKVIKNNRKKKVGE